MFNGVACHTNDRVGWKELSGDLNRHVCLADVDAIRTNGEGDVDAVVDEDGDVVLSADILRRLGDSDKLWEGARRWLNHHWMS